MKHNVLAYLVFSISILLCFQQATANAIASSYINDAKLVGEAEFKLYFLKVYRAKLYSSEEIWSPDKVFVLSIEYFIDISKDKIADSSVEEIKRQGLNNEKVLKSWNMQMKNIFPDVSNGDIINAVFMPGKYVDFFSGDKSIGRIEGDEFVKRFSAIWLGENVSEEYQSLRTQLLGKS